jgi:hypothetical protein
MYARSGTGTGRGERHRAFELPPQPSLDQDGVEKCHNVHRRLLRRLRVGVVVDYDSTTTLRQKPL